MKPFIGALLVLVALPSLAFANTNCNINFNGGLHITDSAIDFSEGNQLRYKIQGRSLWVDSRQLSLSQAQADEVQAYGEALQALVPQAHQMASDGVSMASDAVVMMLQGFAEQDSTTSRKVQKQFSLLQADLDKSFQSTNGFYLGEGSKGDANFPSSPEFHQAFEANVQKIVEEAGKDIAWQAMKMVGWAIFSGKNTDEFDARMQTFGQQMEARGKKLEAQGQQFCSSMVALDQHESNLKAMVPEVKKYDFIAVTRETASR